MSQPIASKNLYELLGNDPELDPDRAEPKPPTKAIDKPLPRTTKRDAPDSRARGGGGGGGRGGRQENFSGNDGAFRDRGAGSYNNRNRYADDGLRQDRHANHIKDTEPRGRGRGRGGGGRGRGGPRDDRHSKTGVSDHPKQAAHGWGGKSGGDEWDDEKAGEAIAKADEGGEFTPAPFEGDGPGEVGEPVTDDAVAAEAEEKTKSYDDYLAERTERSMALGPQLTARKANEGNAKKFPTGKEVSHDDGQDFMAGTGGKAKRVREKKERSLLELDDTRLRDAPRESSGRGRGGFRGGRGEGRGRGRGDGPGRGRGAGRGGRGGRGGAGGAGPNFSDPSSFPSLGGS